MSNLVLGQPKMHHIFIFRMLYRQIKFFVVLQSKKESLAWLLVGTL